MTVAFLVLGTAIVTATAVDVVLTILHPSRRGPITTASGRLVFEAMRRPALAFGRPNLMSGAGAAAIVANVVAWVALLWVGWALIYLPHMDDFAYTPSVEYSGRDFWEALYFSGMSLSTVGFGDIVAESDALRILSVLEAATGFGLITAAMTYVLSVIPRVSSVRSGARSVQSQAGDAAKAADMARDASYLVALQRQVLDIGEQTERFPVLYYFHSEDTYASMYTFFRGAVTVCLQTRWGLSTGHVPHARRYGEELEQALSHTIDHYAMRFMHGHGPEALDRPLDRDATDRLIEHLTRSAGDAGADPADLSPDERRQLSRFAGRAETFLEHLAHQHGQPHEPLPRS